MDWVTPKERTENTGHMKAEEHALFTEVDGEVIRVTAERAMPSRGPLCKAAAP